MSSWTQYFLDDGQYETAAFQSWERKQIAECLSAITRWRYAQPSKGELAQVERIVSSRKGFETSGHRAEALTDAIDIVLADRGLCELLCHGGQLRLY